MTVGANKFQILENVVTSVSVPVMHMQYFSLVISASFTDRTPRLQKSHLEGALRYHLIPGSIHFVSNTGSVGIRAGPTASPLVEPRQDWLAANETGRLLSASDTITSHTTESPPRASF